MLVPHRRHDRWSGRSPGRSRPSRRCTAPAWDRSWPPARYPPVRSGRPRPRERRHPPARGPRGRYGRARSPARHRGETLRESVVPAVGGQRVRSREIEVEQRDDPSGRSSPGHRAARGKKQGDVESAGDHRSEVDDLLDAGSAQRSDSHQYSPPDSSTADDGGLGPPTRTSLSVEQHRAAAPTLFSHRLVRPWLSSRIAAVRWAEGVALF